MSGAQSDAEKTSLPTLQVDNRSRISRNRAGSCRIEQPSSRPQRHPSFKANFNLDLTLVIIRLSSLGSDRSDFAAFFLSATFVYFSSVPGNYFSVLYF